MVCIIDDREDVWKFAPNLITVKKYVYFPGTGDLNAPPGPREPQARRRGTWPGQVPAALVLEHSAVRDAGFIGDWEPGWYLVLMCAPSCIQVAGGRFIR